MPAYSVWERPLDEPHRRLRVVMIGAGASGMTFHYYAREKQHLEYQVYEKNSGIGGTWFENCYPGAGCDIPSAAYQFLFKSNPNWTHFYAKQPEILAYFEETAREIGFYEKVKFNSRVSAATWDEAEGQWHVEITNEETGEVLTDVCDVLINGSGVLNSYKWPKIKGIDTFRGPKLHTAAWDTSIDARNKRVGIIGFGSSGIQVLPEMAKIASKVVQFNRSRSWVTPGLCAELTADGKGNQCLITDEQKAKLAADPLYLARQRRYVEQELQQMFKSTWKEAPEQQQAQEGCEALMRERLGGNEELLNRLKPDYHVGCKRPTPGTGALEAFLLPHVTLDTSGIVEIVEDGIITADGLKHELDIIVAATGFDTTYLPRFRVVGRDKSTTLADKWRNGPRSYLGLAEHGYPNMWHFYGPYSPVAHGSYFPGLDMYAKWMIRSLDKMALDGVKAIDVKDKAVKDYVEHAATWMPRAAWSSNCQNWYKQSKDAPIVIWPGTMSHALKAFETCRFEHFDFEYLDSGNSMAWLGNGLCTEELKPHPRLTAFLDPFVPADTEVVRPTGITMGVKSETKKVNGVEVKAVNGIQVNRFHVEESKGVPGVKVNGIH